MPPANLPPRTLATALFGRAAAGDHPQPTNHPDHPEPSQHDSADHAAAAEILVLLAALPPPLRETLGHLLCCEPCAAAALEALATQEAPAGTRYDEPGILARAVLQRVAQELFLPRPSADSRGSEVQAQELFDDLLHLPAASRREAIAQDRRFHSAELARLLVLEGEDLLPDDVPEALALADLALAVTRPLLGENPATPVLEAAARAWCLRGEVLRLQGDRVHCHGALRKAESLLESEALATPERGLLCRRLGLLSADEGRIDEALALLQRAADLFAEAGDDQELGKALADRGRLLLEEIDARAAVLPLRAALALLDPESHLTPALAARRDLCLCYTELGRQGEAAELVREGRRQLAGITGAALRNADPGRAAQLLSSTHSALLAEGAGFEAAQVTLELARVYAEARRRDDLARLVEDPLSAHLAAGRSRAAPASRSRPRHLDPPAQRPR
ncbi:MAG: hypothetical protein M3O15_02055 [Acidobacteriota bacterium]|nr:hypothetical protein [Acidobacteriota bacterium]